MNLREVVRTLRFERRRVLAMSRDNYAAYIFRADGWYLPELPEDGLVTPDVRWWSAELAPKEGEYRL